MATFAATYSTTSTPNTFRWYSVETPSVFREYKLPESDAHMTRTEKCQYRELQRLAEQHGTSIRAHDYRRG